MMAKAPDGAALAFRVRGDGRVSLLFMHGWAGSMSYWDDLLAAIDLSGLQAITYDMRGHGDSDKAGSVTYDSLAGDAVAVADAAGASRFVIVGFSMSAKFAQYVTSAHPDRVLGQILIAGCPACAIPFPQEVRRDWSARAGNAVRLREVTAAYINRPVSDVVLDRWARAAAVVPEHVLDESLRICTDVSIAERLPSIEVPTVIVGGLHDPIFPPSLLRDAVQPLLRGARLAFVDSNHEVPIEAPLELAAIISAFVAGLGASAASSISAGLPRDLPT